MLLLLSNMWNSDIQMKDPSNVMYAVIRKLWVTDIIKIAVNNISFN